jgi:kynureninase
MFSSDVRTRYRFPDSAPDAPPVVELRAFTHGLQPATVPSMMEHFTEDWRRFGVDAWNEVPNHWRPESGDSVGWWTLPEYLGDAFIAPLLGAPDGTCILQPHVHGTVQYLLSAPEVAERGTTVVVSETAFPSVLHSVQQWADLRDVQPRIVEAAGPGRVDEAGLLNAIGPDTALVALSHVGFTTGAKLPDAVLQTVAQTAQDAGALFLIDGYHSAATMPLDVEALGCDLYVGGLLKEASGSAGNAFLYVRDGVDLTPRLTGWFGDAAPFAFNREPEPHPDVRRRFLGGTTSVASMYHAVEGVRILLDLGLEAVRDHSLALTDRAIERADAAGLPLRSPRDEDRRSAMVLVEVPDAARLCEHLKTKNVYTDSRRNEVLRMAPFVWNTRAEVDRAFDAIIEATSDDSYRETGLPETTGPVT